MTLVGMCGISSAIELQARSSPAIPMPANLICEWNGASERRWSTCTDIVHSSKEFLHQAVRIQDVRSDNHHS